MRIFFLLALILLAPVLGSAQTIEVFGVTGASQVWDDEGNIGFGVPLGAGIGFRSPRGWGVEALFERERAERDFASGVRFDSTITAGRARLLKYFDAGSTQFYAGGGLGVTHITSARSEPPGVGGIFTRTSKVASVSGFAGWRIPVGPRFFVRPEIEVSRAGEHLRIGGNASVGIGW